METFKYGFGVAGYLVISDLTISSSHPGAEMGSKGPAVRRLKWYVSWVQNVVRQFGPYLLFMTKI